MVRNEIKSLFGFYNLILNDCIVARERVDAKDIRFNTNAKYRTEINPYIEMRG